MGLGRVQARAFHEGRGQGLQVGVGGAGGRLGLHRSIDRRGGAGQGADGNGGGALAEDAGGCVEVGAGAGAGVGGSGGSACGRNDGWRSLACAGLEDVQVQPVGGQQSVEHDGLGGDFGAVAAAGPWPSVQQLVQRQVRELVRQLVRKLVRPEPVQVAVCAAGANDCSRPAGWAGAAAPCAAGCAGCAGGCMRGRLKAWPSSEPRPDACCSGAASAGRPPWSNSASGSSFAMPRSTKAGRYGRRHAVPRCSGP